MGRDNSELLRIPEARLAECVRSATTFGMFTGIGKRGKLSQPATVSVVPSRLVSRVGRYVLSFPAVLAVSLAYLMYLLSRRNLADPDLWWHLRNAQYLFTSGHLPIVDSYSYTAPGATVLPFEWLAEIPFYLAYKWAGLTSVFVLVFLLCTAIVLGIFRLSYLASHDVKNSFLVTVGGAVLTVISMGARTLLFGWLYLVVLLLVLEAVRRGGLKWLWLVPPLFCVWVNSHGSWPMGLVLFGVFIATGLVEGCWGHVYATRWSRPQLQKLFLTYGASLAALFVNPFGYHLVFYPFKVMFAAGTGIGNIQEFSSVDFHTTWGKVMIALVLGVLLVAFFSRERWRLDEVAFVIVALYYSLTYLRFIFLAGILLPPIFAKRLNLMSPYDRGSDRPQPNAVALVFLLCLFIFSAPNPSKFQNPVKYPEGAIAYMKANRIQGRVFHEWIWGGYLLWHAPELKVFVDGRGEPYGPNGVFKDYLSAVSNQDTEAVLDKYQVEYVLMPTDSVLVKALESNPKWIVRYSDETSVLFHRSPAL
jgi:hypothetical protein